jgi:hypothetical protein
VRQAIWGVGGRALLGRWILHADGGAGTCFTSLNVACQSSARAFWCRNQEMGRCRKYIWNGRARERKKVTPRLGRLDTLGPGAYLSRLIEKRIATLVSFSKRCPVQRFALEMTRPGNRGEVQGGLLHSSQALGPALNTGVSHPTRPTQKTRHTRKQTPRSFDFPKVSLLRLLLRIRLSRM